MLDEQIATNDGPSCTCYSEDECGSVISSTTSTTGDIESTTQPATTPDSNIEPTDDSAPTTVLTTTGPESGDLEPTDGYEPADANGSTSREVTTTSMSGELTSESPIGQTIADDGATSTASEFQTEPNQETTTDRSIPTSTTPVNELTFPEMETTTPTTADTTTLTTDRLLDSQ